MTEIQGMPIRPLVFICSPFAGDVSRSIENARRYCRFAVDSRAIPFAPHLLFPQFLDDSNEAERQLGLFFGLVLMAQCAEVWVFGSEPSKGMKLEIQIAQDRGLTLRYFTEHCTEVNK